MPDVAGHTGGLQPLTSTSPIQPTDSATYEPSVEHAPPPHEPASTPAPPATGNTAPPSAVKQADEHSGSDSGHDVRSPASVGQDNAVNSSSPTSHGSSGFGDNNLTLTSQQQHQPFLSYTGQPFYQHQYGYVPLDMSGYSQYQNIYSNQG